jgi:HEAT repeat protein
MRASEAVLHLGDDHEPTRDAALAALLKDKGAAVSALVTALGQSMPRRRFVTSVKLLGAFGGVAGVPRLLDALDRGTLDADERAAVAEALAELVGSFLDRRPSTELARLRRHALALAADLMTPVRGHALTVLAVLIDVDDADGAVARRLEGIAARDADAGLRQRAQDALVLHRAARSSPMGRAGAAPVPEGGLAIDLEALVAGHTSTATATPPHEPPVPAGGLAIDFEAMLAHHGATSTPSEPPPSADELLLRRLRDPRWSERQKAVDDVVARGRELVPDLIERLGTDPAARVGICLALARLQAPEAASALLMVATGDAPTPEARDLQALALKALAHSLTGTEEGVAPALLPLLKSPDPFVRSGAVVCLGRLADRVGARAAALLLAKDPHSEVKKAAAIAISESVREDHTDLVLPLLAILVGVPSPPAEGVEAILIALARIDLHEPPVKVRVRHRVRRLVFGFTAAQRRLAITVLDRCYDEHDPPPPWVVEDVLSRLADVAADVRLVAASFVARFLAAGHADAVRRLEDALERGERGVSILVCDALRRHDTALSRAALEATAHGDPDEAVRAHAGALLPGFTPTSSEWGRTALPPSTLQGATTASTTGAASAQTSSAAPIVEPPRPRRVRAAADGAGDVVVPKDPDATGPTSS